MLADLRYYPFGELRTTLPAGNLPYSDRGFTGHRENRDLGLTYMNARFYVPYLNRFLSADTIVPDNEDPQSLNRFSYARNNPLRYTDPSGNDPCLMAGEGGESLCGPPPTPRVPIDEPVVKQITPGLQVIIMPEGYEPTPINEEWAHNLGYINASIDVGETVLAGSVLLGNIPGWIAQLGLAGGDVVVAFAASILSGDAGIVILHESLPPMLVFGQDFWITFGEATIVPAAQAGLTTYGFSQGAIPGGITMFIIGQALDMTTSASSAVYDIARAEGVLSQRFALGFYWDDSANTRWPLPSYPSGRWMTAFIFYR